MESGSILEKSPVVSPQAWLAPNLFIGKADK